MMQWITETLQSASMGPLALPLAFAAGIGERPGQCLLHFASDGNAGGLLGHA